MEEYNRNIGRRDFLNFLKSSGLVIGGSSLFGLGLLNSACTSTKWDLSRLDLSRLPGSKIKLQDPKLYGRSDTLSDYTEEEFFTTYTTKDGKALIVDSLRDPYILLPFEDANAGKNRLEIITDPNLILSIGRYIAKKPSCLNNVKALTSSVFCLDNKGFQIDVIGYTVLSREKIIEIKEIERRIVDDSLKYFFKFRIKDEEKKPIPRHEGGVAVSVSGVAPTSPTGGARGSGGNGAIAIGGGSSGGGSR